MNVKTERTMMAAVLYGKEELRVEPVEIPTLGASDVLVKVNVALTCGTDLKVFRRGYHARMIVPPAVLGHELAGDIVEVGSQVKNFQVGQRVVAANSAPCENCYFCARRQENLCEDLLFNNGAYAEYIRIPGPIVRRNMYEIPPHVGYQDAALIEPLACVMRGLDETHLRPGDTVVVIGLGPIGLMFVRLAKTLDARVIAIGRRKTQLDRAASMGADELISTESVANVVEAVTRLTYRGRGADAAIEAVGQPETWQWAIRMVRSGGTVNLFGGCPTGSEVSLDTALLHYSEITLKSSFHHTPSHIRRALDVISQGQIRAADFVTGEAPLSDILGVLRHMMNRNGHLKTAIVP
ncbi:MAG TPA: zinc-binding dehydrogenase [Bryobacterales bacterium]|jgi:L-iditol 2-dehydrogenase|nr:zinc-binding dehydrogenase [Bryobacterales bacterium]